MRAFLFVLLLSGCTASAGIGGHWASVGPHPHVTFAVKASVGPVELFHSPLSNARPVTDMTALTVSHGPTFGPVQIAPLVGMYAGRAWGACDENGYHCEHTWVTGLTLGAGLTYRHGPFRADLQYRAYDGDSPISGGLVFTTGLEIK